MADLVKEVLIRLIKEHGDSLCSDISRLTGLLYDACPSYRKETKVLISTAREGLIIELKRRGFNILSVHYLSNRLHNATGIDKRLAKWSIKVWAEALELKPPPKTKISHCPRRQDVLHGGGRHANSKRAVGKPNIHIAVTPASPRPSSSLGATQVASARNVSPPVHIHPSPPPQKRVSKPSVLEVRFRSGLIGAAVLFAVGSLLLVLNTIDPHTSEAVRSKICTFSAETTNGPGWYTIHAVGYGEAARLRIDIDIFDDRVDMFVGKTVGVTEHFIIKSLTVYSWKNGEKEGHKFSITPLQFIEHFGLQTNTLACRRWSLDESEFEVPKRIHFLMVMNPWKVAA